MDESIMNFIFNKYFKLKICLSYVLSKTLNNRDEKIKYLRPENVISYHTLLAKNMSLLQLKIMLFILFLHNNLDACFFNITFPLNA